MALRNLRGATPRPDIEALLEDFARRKRYVPPGARPVDAPAVLPLRLQRRARDAGRGAWRAWTDGVRLWFVIGERLPDAAHAGQRTVLRLRFFDPDGVVAATGIWCRTSGGQWELLEL